MILRGRNPSWFFHGRPLGAPDVVPGQVHTLPAEGGKVGEEPVWNLLGLAPGGKRRDRDIECSTG